MKLMIQKLIILFVLIIICKVSISQNQGDSLYNVGDLTGAISSYKQHLQEDEFSYCYNIACCYALLTRKNDSVFYYLQKALFMDSTLFVLSDPDFYSVIKDKRWSVIETEQIKKQTNLEKFQDTALMKKLLRLRIKDQAYYYHLRIAQKSIGYNSPVNNAIWELKDKINAENVNDLVRIIDSIGWPNISKVGENAASAAFLVFQHANLVYRQKYINDIKDACEKGEAVWSQYAKMYDRLMINLGKKQLFGTQVHYDLHKKEYVLFPILEVEKVNERRKQIGLGTIEEYIETM